MQRRPRIPRPTVKRLSLYLRELTQRRERGDDTVSSRLLGNALGLTDAQVRKDLALFGQLGQPGVGYRVAELHERLSGIMGRDREWNAILVGAGNIGRALLAYERFARHGFHIVGVIDRDEALVGTTIGGREVRPYGELGRLVEEHGAHLGVVAVPAEAAQQVADDLIDAGVRGILNFAPRRLDVHDAVAIASVDFSIALEQLAFQIAMGMTGSLDDDGEERS